jgi:cell wall-associated NlpC family hydrolase
VIVPAELPNSRLQVAVSSPALAAPPASMRAELAGALASRAQHVETRASRAATARAAAAAALVTRRNRVASFARAQRGKPYRHGAAGPRAYDCSGLALRSFRQVGRKLPRTAAAQSRRARPISRASVRPGDLVYWGGRGSAYHVGVVVKVTGPRGRMRVWVADAPGGGQGVKVRHPWPGGGHRFGRLIG